LFAQGTLPWEEYELLLLLERTCPELQYYVNLKYEVHKNSILSKCFSGLKEKRMQVKIKNFAVITL
jgi:hypothetical protein